VDSVNLAQAMARALSDAGVRDVFALMGNGNLRMVHHLVTDHGIAVHHARHEAAAIGGADGYARVSGGVGVATVTQGPGFTNAITSIVTAHRAGTPLVLLTSDSSHVPATVKPFAAVQALDPDLLLGPLRVPTVRATCQSGYSDILAALEQARSGQCLVVLVVPAGDDGKPFTGELTGAPARPARTGGPSATQSRDVAEAIERAVSTIQRSERPVILAGRGALEAGEPIEALAGRLGAVLTTSIGGLGLFAAHPANIGIAGGFSAPEAAAVFAEADCLLVFGAGLNPFTTRKQQLFPSATVIHCDTDPDAFGRFCKADIEIQADAVVAAQAILEGIGDLQRPVWAARDVAVDEEDLSAHGALDPRTVCRVLDRLLPEDRTVVVDAGHFTAFPVLHTRVTRPNGLVWPIDFGAVGSSVGAAVGAAAGRPGTLTVLFVGDGGFFMSMGDFAVPVVERLPLLVVCMNDEAYGSELVHMEEAGIPGDEAVFETPDLAAVARALGFTAARIADLDELEPAVVGWDPAAGPLFLDCLIRRDVRSPLYAHI
jgi:thiamine pyrophosphate-dependent acetolactate synthase large subunit-like protein